MRLLAVMCAVFWTATTVPAEPGIDPPQNVDGPIVSVADFGAKPDGSACAWNAFTQAIEECKKVGASKLLIPHGRYVFNDPEILTRPGAHFPMADMSDLVIEGSGSELVFHHIRPVMTFHHCQRVIVRNFSVDWDIDLAVPGRIKEGKGGEKVLEIPKEFPFGEGDRIGAVTEYDLNELTWKKNAIEVYDPKDARLVASQTWSSEGFQKFPKGSTLVIRKYVYDAHAFVFNGPGTGHLAFEDLTIYACPGMAFSGAWCDRGFRFARCKIQRKIDPRRLISATADGIWFGGAQGDILIEDCDFSHQGDDSVNLHGAWVTVASRPDRKTVELAYKWAACPPFVIGEEIKLRRASDLSLIQRAKIIAVERETPDSKTCKVTLDRELPAELATGDFVENTARACGNFLIRNNYFHDHRARGLLIQASNGLVENNRISNVMCAAMQLTTDARYWHEGFVCEDVTIRGNTMEGCNYANWDRHATGRHPACLNVVADTVSGLSPAPIHRNILIEGNTIKDTPGLAIFVTSSEDVIIRNNTIINSNTEPFNGTGSGIGLAARGSIMIARASNVVISGNDQTAKKKTWDRGVYVDAATTKNVTKTGR